MKHATMLQGGPPDRDGPPTRNVYLQLPATCYLLPDAPPVLLPEPMPEPVLPGVVVVVEPPGVVVVVPPGVVVVVLPAVPPALAPSSRRHFSRSAPIMPRHLLLALLLALPEAPTEGLGAVVLLEVLESDVPPDEALPPVVIFSSRRHLSRSAPSMPRHLLLGLVLAPLDALPAVLPVALESLLPPLEAPTLDPVEPVLCAKEALASAKSAAAVAVLMSFNIG